MAPEDVLELFEQITGEAPEDELAYALMDQAYTRRNEMRNWRMLLKLDTSITHTASDTFETEKDLPEDFARPYKAFGGSQDNEYEGVPFEEILMWKGSSNRYTLDMVNNKLRFLGPAGSALTLYFYYLYAPTSLMDLSDAQKSAVTTIVWPKRFVPLLAYDMAELFFGGVDADEITRQMSPMHRAAATRLEKAMVQWDNAIHLKLLGRILRAAPHGHADGTAGRDRYGSLMMRTKEIRTGYTASWT
jgi:hypothetical protein